MKYKTAKEILSEIKHIMYLNDIQMKDLASRLNTSQQNLSKIFKVANPKCSTLFDICNALDIDIEIDFVPKNKDDTE